MALLGKGDRKRIGRRVLAELAAGLRIPDPDAFPMTERCDSKAVRRKGQAFDLDAMLKSTGSQPTYGLGGKLFGILSDKGAEEQQTSEHHEFIITLRFN